MGQYIQQSHLNLLIQVVSRQLLPNKSPPRFGLGLSLELGLGGSCPKTIQTDRTF